MEFDIKSQDDKIANMTHLLQKVKSKNVKSDLEMQWLWSFHSRERVSDFSLEIHAIGPLNSTEQEGKTFYAEQVTRGPRVCEFLTTPRGRIFSLLVFYSYF